MEELDPGVAARKDQQAGGRVSEVANAYVNGKRAGKL